MPWSYPEGKPELLQHVLNLSPYGGTVLDVGPGAGGMRDLLPGKFVMDGLEIFEPYVHRFNLAARYNAVYLGDVRTWRPAHKYGWILLGDVLEHLSIPDAQDVVRDLSDFAHRAVVSVPWTFPQGECEGNVHEEHLQEDLTPMAMAARYPTLQPLLIGRHLGVYTWGR